MSSVKTIIALYVAAFLAVVIAVVYMATANTQETANEVETKPVKSETTCSNGQSVEDQVSQGADPNDQPSADVQRRALEAIRENPEKDWCNGYTPMPDGSIVPSSEIEAKLAAKTPPPPEKAIQKDASGRNESGQDVSKIPNTPRDPDRVNCLKSHYDALSPNERAPESHRIAAEANARGVSPYDVVGC